jgi:hypothetical protein
MPSVAQQSPRAPAAAIRHVGKTASPGRATGRLMKSHAGRGWAFPPIWMRRHRGAPHPVPLPVPGRGRRLISLAMLSEEALPFFPLAPPGGERVPKGRVRGVAISETKAARAGGTQWHAQIQTVISPRYATLPSRRTFGIGSLRGRRAVRRRIFTQHQLILLLKFTLCRKRLVTIL